MDTGIKLNLGCGNDYREGWINVDNGNCRRDLHHDLEVLPLPFGDNEVSHIALQHVLEHIDKHNFINFLRELHRICKPGALIHIECPYYLSENAFTDPTHKNFITTRSFDYVSRNGKDLRELGLIYGYDFEFDTDVRLDADRLSPGCNVIADLTVIK